MKKSEWLIAQIMSVIVIVLGVSISDWMIFTMGALFFINSTILEAIYWIKK